MIKTELTTFWVFLKETKTEIPIIQRDYAQGREGNENLRKKFLTDLKGALDGSQNLKLDFVYGNVVDESLNPLDGQQRLTTLWLLHWYIAYRAGKLKDDGIRNTFKNFTYQTRISSREFCEKLSGFSEPQPEGKSIVKHITNQTWFQSSWKQDPTAIAMLNMLGGDPDKKDNLESVFKDVDFLNYWGILTASNCPITFYFLPLNDFRQPDDLYIKMNARGKQLTGFENFKAELVQHIKKNLKIDQDKKPTETIAHKLDTTWTDVFWINRSNDARIDEIYFAFMNRYFLNQMLVSHKEKDDEGNHKLLSISKISNNDTFKTLYGHESDDIAVEYDGFDIYKEKLGEESLINKKTLERLAKTLDGFYNTYSEKIKSFDIAQLKEVNQLFLPPWDAENSFSYIPIYDKKKDGSKQSILKIEQKERIVFHAICRFFEKLDNGEKNIETPLKQWMRVVWNIVENSGVNTIDSMIGTMRLIDELSEYSHSIYGFLGNRLLSPDGTYILKSKLAKDQVIEEREKASQILYAEQSNDNSETWEKRIVDVETVSFFKGAIRFVFTNGLGEIDWKDFDNKAAWCNKYFDDLGVKEEYRKEALMLRTFISYVDSDGWLNLFNHMVYNNTANTWKQILTNKKWCFNVHNLLSASLLSLYDLETWSPPQDMDSIQSLILRDLVNSNLLFRISDSEEQYRLNYRREYDKHLLYPRNTKTQRRMCMIGVKRNNILSEISKEIKVEDWQIVKGANYFRGWSINFIYKNYTFQWHYNDNIYMVYYDDSNKLNYEIIEDEQNNDKYISFSEEDVTTDNFIEKLDELIKEYRNNQP